MDMKASLTKFTEITNQQFQENSFKNLFCTVEDQFHFNSTTVKAIQLLDGQLNNLSSEDKEALLLDYINGFVRTFYQIDPYTNFSNEDKSIMKQIYLLLLRDIINKFPIEKIEERHYERIRWLIKKTNPAIYQINNNSNIKAKHFVCAEYSSAFQLDLLSIDKRFLIEPILDIGCGEHGYLVEYFRAQHLEAYGMDCLKKNSHYFFNCNWLEFSYGHKKWGTIISHLSFSSHFLHHFLQNDGLDICYAQTYMKILESLVPGGSWIYTPDVPFMENLLPLEEYDINRKWISADFYKTIITKL